jgi:hypothetical protein
LIIVGMGALVAFSTMGTPFHQVASTSDSIASQTPSQDISSTAADSVGTSGSDTRATEKESAPTPRSREVPRPAESDEALIRQGITRFAAAYSSRFKPVAFSSCDVARSDDSATATCQARGADPSDESDSGGTWVFTCRKVADAWKIVSIQPPAE